MKLKKRAAHLGRCIRAQIRRDKRVFLVLAVVLAAVLGMIGYAIWRGDWNRVFTGVLTLLLLLIPPLVEKRFSLRLPAALEISAYVFVFCAGVLGEMGNFYQRFAIWDVLLHFANGFMFAAFGFSLFALFEQKKRGYQPPSAGFLSLLAFCFSMTVGVLWELFEYAADRFLHADMQKDAVLHEIHTVSLPNMVGDSVTHIRDIVYCMLQTREGGVYTFAGYPDIGLTDTMKDLFVNLLGAVVFCVVGYLYCRRMGGRLAAGFIPVVVRKQGGVDNS